MARGNGRSLRPTALRLTLAQGAPAPSAGLTLRQHHRNTMNTTARNSKDEIITAAVELADCQSQEIGQLKERQLVLWALVGVLSVLLMLGA